MLLDLGDTKKTRDPAILAIFADANTKLRKPANLKALTAVIDKLDWYSARNEGLGDLYEGLLEKNAAEKKSGAGQYFTPRPLIDCIVRLMQPRPGEVVQDPAAGTGGFLVAADRYIKRQTDDLYLLSETQADFQRKHACTGAELVPDAHRLCLMNLMLHGIESNVLFFERGFVDSGLTKSVWVYDLRANMLAFGKTHPLSVNDFAEFEFAYQLKTLGLREMNRASAIPGLNRQEAHALPILFPPEKEQRRIAAKLDKLFARTRRVREDLARIPRLIEQYKQAILAAAFRGDLTADWRMTQSGLGSAAELVTRTPAPAQPRGGQEATDRVIPGVAALSVNIPEQAAPEGWCWVSLQRIARQESGHTSSRKHPEHWGGDIPWLSISDAADHHGAVIYDTVEHPTEEGIENSSARVLPVDTVCLSRNEWADRDLILECLLAYGDKQAMIRASNEHWGERCLYENMVDWWSACCTSKTRRLSPPTWTGSSRRH